MSATTAENYAGVLSQRLTAQQRALAAQWLDRLRDILSVGKNEVFPSSDLLDHIPLLIAEIATYLRAPADEEIAANAAVIAKAQELGMLRHAQHASVHQLLREYEILSEILESFVVDETRRLNLQPTSDECFDLLRRLIRSTRTLMRTTIDTFIAEYTSTIQERNDRINTFHRMASHEMRSPLGAVMFAAGVLSIDEVQADPRRVAKAAATVRSNAERWPTKSRARSTRWPSRAAWRSASSRISRFCGWIPRGSNSC
jgi:K+-sensing histidine kinase KdpD